MLDAPFGLFIFLGSFIFFDFMLRKINFPNLFLSDVLSKKRIQAVIIIIILLLIPVSIKIFNIKLNPNIYYFIYFPMYITSFFRISNSLFKN